MRRIRIKWIIMIKRPNGYRNIKIPGYYNSQEGAQKVADKLNRGYKLVGKDHWRAAAVIGSMSPSPPRMDSTSWRPYKHG